MKECALSKSPFSPGIIKLGFTNLEFTLPFFLSIEFFPLPIDFFKDITLTSFNPTIIFFLVDSSSIFISLSNNAFISNLFFSFLELFYTLSFLKVFDY